MVKRHLKRIATPRTWILKRKETTFITKPRSGHTLALQLSITVLLRDMLKVAERRREVTRILEHQEVFVNGKRIKDKKIGIGFMDVLTIPSVQIACRLSLDKKGRLTLVPIEANEAHFLLNKIQEKTKLPQGKTQLNLMNGMNFIVEKDVYKRGDSLLIDMKQKKVSQHFPLGKNASIILTAGKHMGEQGVIEDIVGKHLMYKTKEG